MREDMDSLRAILAEFDADVAEELAKEGERADLWTDIDVPVALVRALLDDNDRLRRCINMAMGCLDPMGLAMEDPCSDRDLKLAWFRLFDAMEGNEPRARLAHEDAG